MDAILMWARKSGWIFAVVTVGALLDIAYLYFTRTRGGLGFRFSVKPGIDVE